LEQQRLATDIELAKAKVASMDDAKKNEALYQEALNAMRAYSGQGPMVLEDD
jgi:hypothetical protein